MRGLPSPCKEQLLRTEVWAWETGAGSMGSVSELDPHELVPFVCHCVEHGRRQVLESAETELGEVTRPH